MSDAVLISVGFRVRAAVPRCDIIRQGLDHRLLWGSSTSLCHISTDTAIRITHRHTHAKPQILYRELRTLSPHKSFNRDVYIYQTCRVKERNSQRRPICYPLRHKILLLFLCVFHLRANVSSKEPFVRPFSVTCLTSIFFIHRSPLESMQQFKPVVL